MTHIKAVTFGLVTVGLLIAASCSYFDNSLSATGTVILRDKDNGICSLAVPEPGQTKTYSFVHEPLGCKDWNDKARKIQLAELPSATTIFIYSDGSCDLREDPWFELKTIKKQTSTSNIEIEYLATFKAGQIVEPGLQMIQLRISNEDGGNRDQTSCVEITTSAAPPSP